MKTLGFFVYINSCLLLIAGVVSSLVIFTPYHPVAAVLSVLLSINIGMGGAACGLRMGVGKHPFPWKDK